MAVYANVSNQVAALKELYTGKSLPLNGVTH